jgi:hypothetical protein
VKWEYRLEEIALDPDSGEHPTLVTLGSEGWEAVSMYGRTERVSDDEPTPITGWRYAYRTMLVVLFKRPATDDAEQPRIRPINDDDVDENFGRTDTDWQR